MLKKISKGSKSIIIHLRKNKIYVLSSTKTGRLLIQISPKNVIYILRSFLVLLTQKVKFIFGKS